MAQRTLDRDLAELGYRRDGHTKGKGHPIYRHPEAGVVVAAGTPGDHRSDANTLAEAKRRIRAIQSTGGAFVDYLCRTYHVPRDGELDVEIIAKDEVARWRASGAAEGISRANAKTATPVVQRARETGRFELVLSRRGKGPSVWTVRGRDYVADGVETDDELPTPPAQTEPAPTPPTSTNGHRVGEPLSALRDVMPELERWISAGVLADLAERDERILVVLSLVDQLLEKHRRIIDEETRIVSQLEEVRGILDGSTEPQRIDVAGALVSAGG